MTPENVTLFQKRTKIIQDRGYMVGHQSAAGQDHRQKCAAAICHRNSCRFSAQPWCYYCKSAKHPI